jgi:hypothetical protein
VIKSIAIIFILSNQFNCALSLDLEDASSIDFKTEYIIDSQTNITVAKAIGAIDKDHFRIIYQIKVPDIDNFEFIIMTNTTDPNGDILKDDALANSVPRLIKKLTERYPDKNFKFNIINWNKQVPLNHNVFNYKFIRPSYMLYNTGYYTATVENITNISEALEASISLFLNTPIEENKRIIRFILLFGGDDEISECDKSLLERSNHMNIPIYIVEKERQVKSKIQVRETNLLFTRPQYIETYRKVNSEELLTDIEQIMNRNIVSKPVANNITIVNSFFGYINPDEASISVATNGDRHDKIIGSKVKNIDGSITITFNLQDRLLSNSTTQISMDAYLNLGIIMYPTLPLKSTPAPSISYTWLDATRHSLPLPSGRIIVSKI